jgi:hypothetical protein
MSSPSTTTRTSPVTSTTVITTLARRLSLIPRAFSSATRVRNTSAAGTCGTATSSARYSPENASASAAADTMLAAAMQKPTTKAMSGDR